MPRYGLPSNGSCVRSARAWRTCSTTASFSRPAMGGTESSWMKNASSGSTRSQSARGFRHLRCSHWAVFCVRSTVVEKHIFISREDKLHGSLIETTAYLFWKLRQKIRKMLLVYLSNSHYIYYSERILHLDTWKAHCHKLISKALIFYIFWSSEQICVAL